MSEKALPQEALRPWPKTLLTSESRGFCAGVVGSVEKYHARVADLRKAQEQDPTLKLTSIGEPAHNPDVIGDFENDMGFVKSVSDVETGTWGIQGPHGTSRKDLEEARKRELVLTVTECPMVTRVKDRVWDNTEKNIPTVYFGERGHEEARAVTEGTYSTLVEDEEEALVAAIKYKIEDPNRPVAFASQTTKNADDALAIAAALKKEFPDTLTPKVEDICFATRDRQAGVKEVIQSGAKAMIIVGSPTSSNATRLFEIAGEKVKTYLIRGVNDLNEEDFYGFDAVGASSSASTPEGKFQELIEWFQKRGSNIIPVKVAEIVDESRVKFKPLQTYDFRKQI